MCLNASYANRLIKGGRLVLDRNVATSGVLVLSADEVADLLVLGLLNGRLQFLLVP
jgi:hypothetical protein